MMDLIVFSFTRKAKKLCLVLSNLTRFLCVSKLLTAPFLRVERMSFTGPSIGSAKQTSSPLASEVYFAFSLSSFSYVMSAPCGHIQKTTTTTGSTTLRSFRFLVLSPAAGTFDNPGSQ